MKNFIKNHPWISLAGVAALIITVYLIWDITGGLSGTTRTIQNNQTQSQTAVREAANSTGQAVNAEVERKTEDGLREQVITPKLQTARRKSAGSAQNLKVLEQQIKENEKILHDINANRAANCAELKRRFPNEVFEYCID